MSDLVHCNFEIDGDGDDIVGFIDNDGGSPLEGGKESCWEKKAAVSSLLGDI